MFAKFLEMAEYLGEGSEIHSSNNLHIHKGPPSLKRLDMSYSVILTTQAPSPIVSSHVTSRADITLASRFGGYHGLEPCSSYQVFMQADLTFLPFPPHTPVSDFHL